MTLFISKMGDASIISRLIRKFDFVDIGYSDYSCRIGITVRRGNIELLFTKSIFEEPENDFVDYISWKFSQRKDEQYGVFGI